FVVPAGLEKPRAASAASQSAERRSAPAWRTIWLSPFHRSPRSAASAGTRARVVRAAVPGRGRLVFSTIGSGSQLTIRTWRMAKPIAANRRRLLEAAEKTTHRYGFGNTAIAD